MPDYQVAIREMGVKKFFTLHDGPETCNEAIAFVKEEMPMASVVLVSPLAPPPARVILSKFPEAK